MDSAGIPWYSTGTVNVTQGSRNVVGVGTNWVNAGLKVGDIFTIDKSRLYQITAVNSNTSLSLQEAYQGATGTAQVYFVIRNFAGTMQAQIAAQVSELVNKYESYIDTELKQITGPAGPTSFPYRGTWATGRSYNGLDVVQYGNQLYMALYGHTSTSANAPGATGTAWTILTVAVEPAPFVSNVLDGEYIDIVYGVRAGWCYVKVYAPFKKEVNNVNSLTLGILPEGFRPYNTIAMPVMIDENTIKRLVVFNNGEVRVVLQNTPLTTSMFLFVNFSFPV